MRFTLTGPDFAPPVTEVGGEEEAFGDWYPQSEYLSSEEFDERFPCDHIDDDDSDDDWAITTLESRGERSPRSTGGACEARLSRLRCE